MNYGQHYKISTRPRKQWHGHYQKSVCPRWSPWCIWRTGLNGKTVFSLKTILYSASYIVKSCIVFVLEMKLWNFLTPSWKRFTIYSFILMLDRQGDSPSPWCCSCLPFGRKTRSRRACVLERMTKWVKLDGAFKKCPGAIPFCLLLLHHHPPCSCLLCDLVVFQLHLPCITSPQHLDGPTPLTHQPDKKRHMHVQYNFAAVLH